MIDILIPSRNRPKLLANLIDNIRMNTPEDVGLIFAICDGESEKICWDKKVSTLNTKPQWTTIARSQYLYMTTNAPYFYIGQDDSYFHPQWLEKALPMCKEIEGVVAVNDGVTNHGSTALFSRKYVEELSCSLTERDVIGHLGYHHNYAEAEVFATARFHKRWAYCEESRVSHLKGFLPDDDTYRYGNQFAEEDGKLFASREHLWEIK